MVPAGACGILGGVEGRPGPSRARSLTSLDRLTRSVLVRLTATTLAPEACRAFTVSRPIPAGWDAEGRWPCTPGQGWGQGAGASGS